MWKCVVVKGHNVCNILSKRLGERMLVSDKANRVTLSDGESGGAWRYTPVILALGRPKQELKFKAS
jgi:hypothetical protein